MGLKRRTAFVSLPRAGIVVLGSLPLLEIPGHRNYSYKLPIYSRQLGPRLGMTRRRKASSRGMSFGSIMSEDEHKT